MSRLPIVTVTALTWMPGPTLERRSDAAVHMDRTIEMPGALETLERVGGVDETGVPHPRAVRREDDGRR